METPFIIDLGSGHTLPLKASISCSIVLGCHSCMMFQPAVIERSADSFSKIPLEYLYNEGWLERGKETNAFFMNYTRDGGTPKLRKLIAEEAYKALCTCIEDNTNNGIYICSDNLNGPSYLKMGDLVKYLIATERWSCWASPIVNNPNHRQDRREILNTFCQVWCLVRKSQWPYMVKDSSWQIIPKGGEGISEEEFVNKFSGRNHTWFDKTGTFVSETITPDMIKKNWGMGTFAKEEYPNAKDTEEGIEPSVAKAAGLQWRT